MLLRHFSTPRLLCRPFSARSSPPRFLVFFLLDYYVISSGFSFHCLPLSPFCPHLARVFVLQLPPVIPSTLLIFLGRFILNLLIFLFFLRLGSPVLCSLGSFGLFLLYGGFVSALLIIFIRYSSPLCRLLATCLSPPRSPFSLPSFAFAPLLAFCPRSFCLGVGHAFILCSLFSRRPRILPLTTRSSSSCLAAFTRLPSSSGFFIASICCFLECGVRIYYLCFLNFSFNSIPPPPF